MNGGPAKALFCAAALVAFSFNGASAELVEATYTGTVTSASDPLGLFPDGDLVGMTATASFIYDTTKGTWVDRSPTLNFLVGGMYVGTTSPMI